MSDKLEAVRVHQKGLETAQADLAFVVAAAYPRETQVKVSLSPGTSHGETWGRVIGHGSGRSAGYVRVRLDTRMKLVRNFRWDRLET